MPRPQPTPWRMKLLELLSDGEWWDYKTLVRECSSLVPPARAWRHAETMRERHYQKTGQEVRERTRGGRADTIKTGQRYFVQKSLQQLKREGKIEVVYTTENPKRQAPDRIRLKRAVHADGC